MILDQAIQEARELARELKVDPALTVAEVYTAELLRRLQRALRGGLVWKGGTVLRLEGSERFSRDLDATARAALRRGPRIAHVLRKVGEGLPLLMDLSIRKQPQTIAVIYRFSVAGLLHPLRILVEVSLREKILMPTTTISTARIAHRWGLEPVLVARLDAAEVLAEKVRALVMRGAGRDIFDVHWLLQRGVAFDPGLFVEKMRYYDRVGMRIDPVAAVKKAARKLERYNPGLGKTEIANLFPRAQRNLDFQAVVNDVAGALRSWSDLPRPEAPCRNRHA
jgi:predicted nucleotidyltransferase component of viral defense system